MMPYSIGLMTALLKREEFNVGLFDCTFYLDDIGTNYDHFQNSLRQFDWGERGVHFKENSMREDWIRKVEEFAPDMIAVSVVESTYVLGRQMIKCLPKEWKDTVVLWGGVFATFGVEKILGEGEGLAPLWKGLSAAAGYGQEGSWLHNIYVQVCRDETAILAALFTAAVLCWWGLQRRTSEDAGERQLSVAGMLAISGLATLLQLRSRAFHHYMLLAVPCLVVSSTLAWRYLWSRRTGSWRTRKGACLALLLLPIVPFLVDSGIDESFLAGRLPLPVERVIPIRWHQREELRDDLEPLRQHVPPGASILLVPARHNSIHFLLGKNLVAVTHPLFLLPEWRT